MMSLEDIDVAIAFAQSRGKELESEADAATDALVRARETVEKLAKAANANEKQLSALLRQKIALKAPSR